MFSEYVKFTSFLPLENKKKRLSQNKLEMASVVSFQIEVIWISLKR